MDVNLVDMSFFKGCKSIRYVISYGFKSSMHSISCVFKFPIQSVKFGIQNVKIGINICKAFINICKAFTRLISQRVVFGILSVKIGINICKVLLKMISYHVMFGSHSVKSGINIYKVLLIMISHHRQINTKPLYLLINIRHVVRHCEIDDSFPLQVKSICFTRQSNGTALTPLIFLCQFHKLNATESNVDERLWIFTIR